MINNSWIYIGAIALTGAGMGLVQTREASAQLPSSEFYGIIDFLIGDGEDSGRGRPGVERGPEASCLINPGERDQVWSLQPLLLLQGNVEALGLRPIGAAPAEWRSPALSLVGETSVFSPGGEVLQPGEAYEWLYFQEPPFSDMAIAVKRVPFRVLDEGPSRNRITRELTALETQLTAEGADESAIAQARSNYFFDNDLPADGFQALFSVESPSQALVDARNLAIDQICDPAESSEP